MAVKLRIGRLGIAAEAVEIRGHFRPVDPLPFFVNDRLRNHVCCTSNSDRRALQGIRNYLKWTLSRSYTYSFALPRFCIYISVTFLWYSQLVSTKIRILPNYHQYLSYKECFYIFDCLHQEIYKLVDLQLQQPCSRQDQNTVSRLLN